MPALQAGVELDSGEAKEGSRPRLVAVRALEKVNCIRAESVRVGSINYRGLTLLTFRDLLCALCLISIDEKRTVTLGVAFLVGEFVIKWPMLTAASLIGSLPTILLYLFLQRFYVEGLARGAVKG